MGEANCLVKVGVRSYQRCARPHLQRGMEIGMNTKSVTTHRSAESALALAADMLLVGYDIAAGTASIGEALKHLAGAFTQIVTRLDAVLRDLDKVIDEIRRISREIRGHLDRAFLHAELARMLTSAQTLQAYLHDATEFSNHIEDIELETVKLSAAIHSTAAFTSGLASIVLCGPPFALWVQAHTMLMRSSLRQSGERLWVWDHPFHQHMLKHFQAVFANAQELSARMEIEKRKMNFPTKNACEFLSEISGGGFWDLRYYPLNPVPGGHPQLFSIRDPSSPRPDRGEIGDALWATGPSSAGDWRRADGPGPFQDSKRVQEANAHYRDHVARWTEILAHVEMIRAAELKFAELLKQSARPADWPSK